MVARLSDISILDENVVVNSQKHTFLHTNFRLEYKALPNNNLKKETRKKIFIFPGNKLFLVTILYSLTVFAQIE